MNTAAELNLDIDLANNLMDDPASQEVKSIEINIQVIKAFFVNTISLYECIIKKFCKSCNMLKHEEFINLHKNLCEFEDLFRVFEVSFDKNLINSLVKVKEGAFKRPKLDVIQITDGIVNEATNQNNTSKYPCLVSSCSLAYSSEEGARIHFIKNHCKRGDVFEMINEDNQDVLINYSQLKRDKKGRFICEFEDCVYASVDRSNFKVHVNRHYGDKKFICNVCRKGFFTRDPLMIHFVRLHMKEVNWGLASKNIRTLRKTIRRITNRKYSGFCDNEDISDSDTDLNGPLDADNSVLNEYISQAICDYSIGIDEPKSPEQPTSQEIPISDCDEIDSKSMIVPVNSFNVSLSLKDTDYFSDSATFKAEGVSSDIDDLITKTQNPNTPISTTMSLDATKDKIVKKEIPQRTKKYKCPHKSCSQDFFTTKNLLIHLKASHDPANPIPCQEIGCTARFKSPALLAQHQKRHRVQYSCSICNYKTHLAALMTRHNRQHAGEQLFHECSVCHEKFEYLGALSSHRRKVHNESEPLACSYPECGKKFKTIIGLNKHRREVHLNMKAEISCEWPDCNAIFSNRTSMTNHMRIHTNERPYQCTWQDCGKWFRLKETLKRHLKLHQGYKPFPCPFDHCDRSFFTKRSMKSHIEKIHLKSSSKSTDQPNIQDDDEEFQMDD